MRCHIPNVLRTGALVTFVILTGCVQVTPEPTPSASPAMPTTVPSPTEVLARAIASMTPIESKVMPTSTWAPSPTSPRATPSPATRQSSTVRAYQDSIQLLTYPYESFGRDVLDRTYNIGFRKFDVLAFGNATRTPSVKNFKSIIVENEYLSLTFLPDLGGRLYQVLFKPTGQTIFYNNRFLKPTPWGPEQQSGWLAIGGMEWALPVNEHGYEWGMPWHYQIDGETVTLWDTDASDRVRARISITLPSGAAYFIVHPRIENPTRSALSLQFWINAQVALNDGLKNRLLSPELEFHLPGDQAWIHSTGSTFVPQSNIPATDAVAPVAPINWHLVGGRDLAQYKNWEDYLGFFIASPTADFAGMYNPTNNLGLARIFPRERVPGVKLFAWGPRFQERSLYTDDDSEYVELWGGLPRTFFKNDDFVLGAGESRAWDEYWIPFAGTGGLTTASRSAILHLSSSNNRAAVDVAATARATQGTLVLTQDQVELARWNVSLDPGSVFHRQVETTRNGSLRLYLTAPDGTLLGEAFSN